MLLKIQATALTLANNAKGNELYRKERQQTDLSTLYRSYCMTYGFVLFYFRHYIK